MLPPEMTQNRPSSPIFNALNQRIPDSKFGGMEPFTEWKELSKTFPEGGRAVVGREKRVDFKSLIHVKRSVFCFV